MWAIYSHFRRAFLGLGRRSGLFAHDEWFRGLDLEPALGEASLVLVGRVVDASETKC